MVELDGRTVILTERDDLDPKAGRHRVAALDCECVIPEITFRRFDENDIVRIEDDYNRAAMPKTWVAVA